MLEREDRFVSFKDGGEWHRIKARDVGKDIELLTSDCKLCGQHKNAVVTDVMQLGFWIDTGILVTYCGECNKYTGFVYQIDASDNLDRQIEQGLSESEYSRER